MDKRELLRIVRTPEEEIIIDRMGKKSGRGAYLCASISCFERAIKTKAIAQALNCSISESIIEELRRNYVDE